MKRAFFLHGSQPGKEYKPSSVVFSSSFSAQELRPATTRPRCLRNLCENRKKCSLF